MERKLTTIVAVDAVGFSKLMGENETLTLETLKHCRAIIDEVVQNHHGRIFGGAGDSLLADFASPVQAVLAAGEFQHLLAERNEHPDTQQPMRFRVGINMGDVIIEGDNLYGDGVNVAARLEGVAKPGGVCIAAKVHEEVRRKIDLAFSFRGKQELKNIDEPVGIWCLSTADDPHAGEVPCAPGSAGMASLPEGAGADLPKAAQGLRAVPLVVVHPVKVISGGDEARDLAAGLEEDIHAGLVAVKAIQVAADDGDEMADGGAPDFALEGSLRASGQRLRLSFTLADVGAGKQVWSERYDRTLEDVFDLQDEVSRAVVFAVRLHVKEQVFERLKETDNADLSTPELLDKAAGYFVSGQGGNAEAEAALRLAVEREPGNSMALAMLAASLFRIDEFSASAISAERAAEIRGLAERAVALAPQSYYARMIDAMVRFDQGEPLESVRTQVDTALDLNRSVPPALGLAAICQIHGGDVDDGLAALEAIASASEGDPHRPRHLREIVLAHFLKGDAGAAARAAARLVDEVPDLRRNWPVNAAMQAAAGNEAAAKAQAAKLLEAEPGLTLATLRPQRIEDAAAAARYREALIAAGLPEA